MPLFGRGRETRYSSPAAAAIADADTATRERLRESGLSDETIDATLAEAAAIRGVPSPVDPREVAAELASGTASRVVGTVTYVRSVPITAAAVLITETPSARERRLAAIDAAIVNPLSAADDGLGGITNIVGDVYGTVFGTESTDGGTFVQELPEREGLRRRGGLGGV